MVDASYAMLEQEVKKMKLPNNDGNCHAINAAGNA